TLDEIEQIFTDYHSYLRLMPPGRAEEQLARILEKARGLSEVMRQSLLWSIIPSDARYFESVLAPLAKNRWSWLDKTERDALLEEAFDKLRPGVKYTLSTNQTKAAALAMIRPHVAEVDPPTRLFMLINYRKTFPLELWLPHLPRKSPGWERSGFMHLPQEDTDLTVAYLTEDLDQINSSELAFVKARASEATRTRVFDDLLRSDAADQRALALQLMDASGSPASTAAIEAGLAIELGADPRDLLRLHRIGQILLVRRPSENLFAVARALLRSDELRLIAEGLKMADALGREDLVPDLVPHLRSLDANIRTLAAKTLAGIRAIAKIQEEFPAKRDRK
ncbi:MAG: hypothetical protein ACYSX0_17305, partial [Planctomycetota bacterium]